MDVLPVKPRLRGVSHEIAFFVSLALGGALVLAEAGNGRSRVALGIYAVTLCGLFGVSALYHRHTWSDSARRWMRRADHSMIFVFIAGTYTPVAVLALHGTLATVVLFIVWGGALGGVVLKLAWIDAPKPLIAGVYVALGWVACLAFGQLPGAIGVLGTIGLGAGGLLYTLGAVVYARQSPDPLPAVFGYHEVFHALVIAAAALQFAVIAFAVA